MGRLFLRNMLSSGSSGEHEVSQVIIPSYRSSRLNASRILNILMITLFAFVIVLHSVCVVVLEKKHNELVDKFRDHVPNIEDNCVLFINSVPVGSGFASADGQWGSWRGLTNNTQCDIVIRGSEALTGCALFMMVFLGIRTVLYKKDNLLGILDGVEVLATGLFAGVLAVLVTLGKNETCKTLEDEFSAHCKDIMITYDNQHARLYRALLTAEVTSWIAVSVMCLITIVTGIRLLLLMMDRYCHGRAILEHAPLLEHNYFLNLHRTSYI